MAFIGNTPTQQGFTPAIDYFSGNASTTAFTLSRPVASVAQVQAVIENVPQNPGDAFTVSGNTITFTSAPPSGTNNIYVYYTSPITTVIQPGQGTVSPSSLSTGGPYWNTSSQVGIGTTSPAFPLDVVGQASDAVGVVIRGRSADNVGSLRFYSNDGATFYSGIRSASDECRLVTVTAIPLTFSTTNTERMRIDSSGRVTMPYQPAFSAQGSYSAWWQPGTDGNWYIPTSSTGAANGTVSGSNAGFGMTAAGQARFNNGSCYNADTGTFTAPVAGKYFFFASGLFRRNSVTATEYGQLQSYINGTAYYYGWDQQPYLFSGSSGMEFIYKISFFVDLAANDAVTVRFSKNGTIETYSQRFIFGGHLVC